MVPDYVAVPHIAYTWMIVAYFFLGGLGAGAFLLSAAAICWKEQLKPVAKTAGIIAPLAVGLGLLFLVVDLGKPERFWRLLVTFNYTSAISWGVWFLNVFFALSVLNAWLLLRGKASKAVAWAGAPVAILVGAYTGVLLSQSLGNAFWHSAFVPVLFLNSGILTGVAATAMLSGRSLSDELSAKLAKIIGWLVVAELGLIVVELFALLNGDAESVEVAQALLGGKFAFLFLGVELLLGALVPLAILFRRKVNAAALATASVLVLIGVFTMRYVIVIGGQTIN